MRAGLDNRHLSLEEVREGILDQGRQEMGVLQKGLVVLETVAGVSPLLGLLGTVLGMIKVFQQVSEVGVGQANLLAGGISEAILTTAPDFYCNSITYLQFIQQSGRKLIWKLKIRQHLLKSSRFQAPKENRDAIAKSP